MKSHELRIGNVVINNNITTDKYGKEFTITGILNQECFGSYAYDNMHGLRDINECPASFSKLEPIPLTEEWLVRLGFSIMQHPFLKSWYEKSYVALEGGDELDNMFLTHQVKIYINTLSKRAAIHNCTEDAQGASVKHFIEYVHQLQNLY